MSKECVMCEGIDYHEIIECITCALDAKDQYTAGHSKRVSDMAMIICRLMNISEADIQKIHIAAHLHERYDGKGYPDGLSGKHIPLGARIIAICDSIDAMNSNRCYRKAHGLTYCYGEIEKNLGKMYDPVIGELVLEHWQEVTSEDI